MPHGGGAGGPSGGGCGERAPVVVVTPLPPPSPPGREVAVGMVGGGCWVVAATQPLLLEIDSGKR